MNALKESRRVDILVVYVTARWGGWSAPRPGRFNAGTHAIITVPILL
jgi:hypothetical protein